MKCRFLMDGSPEAAEDRAIEGVVDNGGNVDKMLAPVVGRDAAAPHTAYPLGGTAWCRQAVPRRTGEWSTSPPPQFDLKLGGVPGRSGYVASPRNHECYTVEDPFARGQDFGPSKGLRCSRSWL